MLGLGTSLVKGGKVGRAYVKDGLKLYMPYRGDNTTKGTQFVGTGSTSFDGVNDYVSVADDSTLDFGTGDFSVAGWFKWERGTASDDSVGGIGKHDNSLGWYLRPTTGDNWYMVIDDGAEAAGSVDMTGWDDGGWHHIAGSWDRDGLFRGYFDGVATTTIDITGADGSGINNSAILDIGGATGTWATDYFPGSIKNVAIWNRALTATEVQNVMYKTYAEVSGRLASGLVSWWSLDGEVGSDGNAGSGYILDEVAGAGSTTNLGTITGATVDEDLYGGDTPVIPRAIDNAPTVQADAIGAGSALFDGVDDYIGISVISLSQSSNYTLSAWFLTSNSSSGATNRLQNAIFSESAGYQHDFGIDGGKLTWHNYDAPSWQKRQGATTVSDGEWHHGALVHNSDMTVDIYLDGSLDLDGADGTSGVAFTIDLIGLNYSANYFDGNIAQAGIWTGALTQAQIQSIMEKTYEELTASEKTNLVSYYPLDTVSNLAAGSGNVKDSHGSNHGTLA